MKIITISGLDGSGKSTQVEMLKQELERQGSKVFYFHAVAFSLAQKIVEFRNKYCLLCRLLGKCKVKRLDSRIRGNDNGASVTRANPLQIFLRKVFLRVDLWRFELLRNKLRNKNYDYILSDRYFYDTVVNIEFLEINNAPTLDSRLRGNDKILKPDTAIYLQTDPTLIMSRERVPDQGLEYLKKKKKLYDAHATEWNMKVIDGNRVKEEIFKDIRNFAKFVSS